MRILTYNIAGNKGRGRPQHLEEVAALILTSGADVVGLQEVVDHGGMEQPEKILARLTGMHAHFQAAHLGKRHILGNAVLSREPILASRAYELPHRFPERRMLSEVETRVGDLRVTVFNTHLVHLARAGALMRRVQATEVARYLQECRQPRVLVGDLNAAPQAGELHSVRTASAQLDHLHGLRSWPARRPWIQYDHIWPGPGWEVEEIQILDPHVSDHRPVLAHLRWNGTGTPAPSAPPPL
jgi:endonuclease/exonuclease/phosphatase family metal-dependent hydrolase